MDFSEDNVKYEHAGNGYKTLVEIGFEYDIDENPKVITGFILNVKKMVGDEEISDNTFHASDCVIRYKWNELTKTYGRIDFYQGNGESSISVTDESVVFFAEPSGAGGDASNKARFKRDIALDRALKYICGKMTQNQSNPQ